MPRNVRNFWIEASVDGVQSTIGTGPRAKDGGFTMTIKQRDLGSITIAAEISGRVLPDGGLVLTIHGRGVAPGLDAQVIRVETKR